MLTVGREEGPAIVAFFKGQAGLVAAVEIHDVDLRIPVAGGGKGDLVAQGRHYRLGIIAGGVGQLTDHVTLQVGDKNIICIIKLPDVAPGTVRGRRTIVAGQVGRSIEDQAIAGEVKRAGGAAFAGGDQLPSAAVDVHGEHLVALVIAKSGLITELCLAERQIGFGIFPAIGEHFDIFEMLFTLHHIRICRCRFLLGAAGQDHSRHHYQ